MSKQSILDCMTLVGSTPSPFAGTKIYVSTGAVDCDHIDYTSTEEVTYEDRPSRANLVADEGDILFAKMCATKKTLRLDEETVKHIYSTGFCAVRANKSVMIPELLVHLLSSEQFLAQKDQNSSGATQKAITNSGLTKIKISIPELSEQKGLAEKLDTIDTLIAARREQLAKMDQLIKSRFIELFGTIKSNQKGHPVVRIGECAKLQGGFAFKSSDYVDDGIRLVQISNVNKDTLDWDSINCVPQTFLQKYKDFELHIGDLVLAMTRPVIKSLDAVKIAMVSEDDVPSLLNQRAGRFVIDKSKLDAAYLMSCCQMTEFREYVEAMSGNSLQPNISSKQVENYSIILPPMELQKQFAAFVEQTDKSKLAIQQSLDKLETLKKSLMQEYFG